MLKEIFFLALLVAVAQCANEIPINQQGKNYPLPIADPDKSDDYFDDRFYPDINDESIVEAPKDNRGKPGGGSKPAAAPGGARLGAGGTTPGRGATTPGGGGTRPAAGGTRPSAGGSRQNTGRTRPAAGGTRRGQGGTRADQGRQRPGNNQGRTRQGGGASRPAQGAAGGRKQGTKGTKGANRRSDLSKYKDSPAKYIFKSPSFNEEGKTPIVNYFKTSKKEYTAAGGGPNDEYVLEVIDGDPSGLGLAVQTIGKDSRLILKNPKGNNIVGRVKIYRGAYTG
uniref:Uncharacterized protein n=1 Tax=Lutzomyia ayacuchensis TaxID=252632 RepID=L0MXT6_LUTAY|nr:hypothetical protein [Lutzomyia ayacuchensis]